MASGGPSSPEAITVALDRFEAAQAEVAALSFDVLTAPQALSVKDRLETVSRRQAAVDHRLTQHLTRQGSPVELAAPNGSHHHTSTPANHESTTTTTPRTTCYPTKTGNRQRMNEPALGSVSTPRPRTRSSP